SYARLHELRRDALRGMDEDAHRIVLGKLVQRRRRSGASRRYEIPNVDMTPNDRTVKGSLDLLELRERRKTIYLCTLQHNLRACCIQLGDCLSATGLLGLALLIGHNALRGFAPTLVGRLGKIGPSLL